MIPAARRKEITALFLYCINYGCFFAVVAIKGSSGLIIYDLPPFLFIFFALLYFDTRIATRTIIIISAIKLMIAAMIIEITVNAGTINDAVSAGGL